MYEMYNVVSRLAAAVQCRKLPCSSLSFTRPHTILTFMLVFDTIREAQEFCELPAPSRDQVKTSSIDMFVLYLKI